MSMQKVVSITSQGQLTIPQGIRKAFGIEKAVKAVIEKKGKQIIVKPRVDFWSLESSLKSEVKLTDKELKEARESFSGNWGKHV